MIFSAETWERVTRHLNLVQKWVRRRYRYLDRDDAEDALTWTLIKASALDPQPPDFEGYVGSRMKWTLTNMRRRHLKRVKLLKLNYKPKKVEGTNNAEILLDLNPFLREFYVDGKSIKEIAHRRHMSNRRVISLLNEAEENLYAKVYGTSHGARVSLGRWRAGGRRRGARAPCN